MQPSVPQVVPPKKPIQADAALDEGTALSEAARPKGLESYISAGTLKRKAFTIKATLLGE